MLALFAERGGDPERPGKKHPLDCLLWQAARPGEPRWDTGDPELPTAGPAGTSSAPPSPCDHLGDGFDVQGGGRDLVFPHHEMSASEGQVLTGSWPFARHYVHAGMVGLDGEKMSKSQGNLVFVSRAAPATVDDPMADPAGAARPPLPRRLGLDRRRPRGGRDPAGPLAGRGVPADRAGRPTRVLAEVRRHLADDLDAPAALAAVDRWADGSRHPRRTPTRPRPTWCAGPSTPSSASASETVRAASTT